MAWIVPMTWTDESVLTASQMNTFARDNFLNTMPALASGGSRIFVSTGAFGIRESIPAAATINTTETTDSTSYTDLDTLGPQLENVVTGERAIVIVTARMQVNVVAANCAVSYDVDDSGASDTRALISESGTVNANGSMYRASLFDVAVGMEPGAHTFCLKYRVTSGTGMFVGRKLVVIPL